MSDKPADPRVFGPPPADGLLVAVAEAEQLVKRRGLVLAVIGCGRKAGVAAARRAAKLRIAAADLTAARERLDLNPQR
ncbi:hypothetical protein [Streptomyces sp. H27-D2]|uniref:hypothetical protein n=1 Tax=Streptomyces sp. H27-D2 TaxID=3046304 RepID=UPI002DBC1685|nr:hypothetical protein [Streptomyces sp. H27-D2]MEC4016075.1 hypothetical protein [Streptomyces sp. H27-D2]